MSLFGRINDYLDKVESRRNEFAETVIFENYYYFPRITVLYPSLKRNHLLPHALSLTVNLVILIYHIWCLAKTAMLCKNDILIATNSIHMIFIVILIYSFIATTNRKAFDDLHVAIGNNFFDYEENLDSEFIKFHKKFQTIKMRINLVLGGIAACAAVVVVVGPNFDNMGGTITYERGSVNMKLPIPLYHPIDTHEGLYFVLALLGECYCVGSVVLILITMIVTNNNISINVITQLEFLLYKIKNVEKRARQIYNHEFALSSNLPLTYKNPDFLKCYELCLKRCFKHHQILVRSMFSFNLTTKIPYFAAIFAGGIILAMSTFLVVSGSTDKYGTLAGVIILCLAEILNLTMICYLGQRITNLSEEVNEAFYDIKWYNCPAWINSSLRIASIGSIKKLMLTGMFQTHMTYETYLSMWNTAFSYFNLLRAVKSEGM